MSGGHFGYGCNRISQFADELQHEIDTNNDKSMCKYGEDTCCNFRDETMFRLRTCQRIIRTAGKLARECEWLYSGDHGEDSFNDLVDRIMGGVDE